MFSLIQKILKRARSFDALFERIEKIESHLQKFDRLADENEALWQFIEERKENEGIFVGTAEEFAEEFTDIMERNLKPQGDA